MLMVYVINVECSEQFPCQPEMTLLGWKCQALILRTKQKYVWINTFGLTEYTILLNLESGKLLGICQYFIDQTINQENN